MLKSMRAAALLADELPGLRTVVIQLDASQALADLGLLSDAAQRSQELRQILLDLGDLGAHLRFVYLGLAAEETAPQIRQRLELSDRLAELVRAVRAGDFDPPHTHTLHTNPGT